MGVESFIIGAGTSVVTRHDQSSAGFAQITLLLMLVVIAASLTVSLAAARGTSRQAAALERLIRNGAIAQSGFRRLTAALDQPEDDLEVRALARRVPVELGGVAVELGIESEGGKLDVLAADPALFGRYLEQHALAADERSRLLVVLGDARARHDAPAALEAVDLALAAALPVSALRRDITRFGAAGIDPQYASARVLAAVPNLTDGEARQIAGLVPAERAQFASRSRYFTSGGRRFSLVARIAWAPGQVAEWRLPIEISTAGKAVVLGGAF